MTYTKPQYRKLIQTCIILITFATSACSHAPYAIQNNNGKAAQKDKQVFVINHGWHTAFVLPSHDIQTQIPELKSRFPNARYLTFGWGDEEVYQADEVTFLPSTIAIMLPTKPVVHIVARQSPPNTSYPNVVSLCLANYHYHALLQYIQSSLKYTPNHTLIPTDVDDGEDSQFYYATGTYYFMNTCNNWTAKGLQSAGLDISPTFKFTATSVMSSLKYKLYLKVPLDNASSILSPPRCINQKENKE